MEVPEIGSAVTSPTPLGPDVLAGSTLQANSTTSIDMPVGDFTGMSITIANQVDIMYAQITQGGLDEQILRAVLLLLVAQLLLNGGVDERMQENLSGLIEAFNQAGNWARGSAYALVLLITCIIFVTLVMKLFKVKFGEIAR